MREIRHVGSSGHGEHPIKGPWPRTDSPATPRSSRPSSLLWRRPPRWPAQRPARPALTASPSRAPRGQAVAAGGGSDRILGGDGPDNLLGETGNDTVFGNGGDDRIDGGSGDDKLFGGFGNDTLVAGFGHDVLDGGMGDDNLDGGAAPDRSPAATATTPSTAAPEPTPSTAARQRQLCSDSGPDTHRRRRRRRRDLRQQRHGGRARRLRPGQRHDLHQPVQQARRHLQRQGVREGRIVNCERSSSRTRSWMRRRAFEDSESRNGVTFSGTERNDNLLGGPGADHLIGLGGDDVIWGNHLHDGPIVRHRHDRCGPRQRHRLRQPRRQRHRGRRGRRLPPGRPEAQPDLGRPRQRHDPPPRPRPEHRRAGDGDDTVEAYAQGAATVDCGPGNDRVNIGFNRSVRTRNCETVKHRYTKHNDPRQAGAGEAGRSGSGSGGDIRVRERPDGSGRRA